MSYNTKNYTEQGGDVTRIGGKLIIEEGGSVEGLPSISNLPEGSSVDALLVALKESGYMVKDEFAVDSNLIPSPTEPQLVANHAKVESVSYGDGEIEVVVPVDELTAFPSSVPEQGTHKWIGLEIKTGLTNVVGIKYNGYALTSDDASEATSVGCSNGSFVLYIKADEVVDTPKVFTLAKPGYKDVKVTVKVTDNQN